MKNIFIHYFCSALERASDWVKLFTGLIFVLLFVLSTMPLIAATQTIDGDPIDVMVYDAGRIEPYYDNWSQKYQYFGRKACNNVLWLNNGSIGYDCPDTSTADCPACTNFTAVSNSMPDSWTINTVYDAGATGIRITQQIKYTNGAKYYRIYWNIANTGSSTYTDLRFHHGGDTYFGGDDRSNGSYDSGLKMVYLTNEGVTGIMGLLGSPTSQVDHYMEDDYSSVVAQMNSGDDLPDTVDASYQDAGYAVEWVRSSLAPGETWSIEAIEKWTASGDVQVFAPAGQSGTVGTPIDYSFSVQNLQGTSDTFNLSTSSSLGWTVSLPGGDTVTIDASSSQAVTVRVTPTSGGTDLTSLTATSQTTPSVTNNDSVTTEVSTSSGTWYLAEGCTNGFTEYILVQNPSDTTANITVTFMDQDGNETPTSFNVNPHSRYTLNVNNIVSNKSIGAKIESTVDSVSVERAMYWPVTGRNGMGSHCSKAIETSATTWYLAEGCTQGFDEWILILNPSQTETAEVTVSFYDEAGNTQTKSFTIPPHSRYTLYVNNTLSGVSMSAVVQSTNSVSIIAERSMYWDSGDFTWTDGHCSFGISTLSTDWYFAEGSTQDSFSEWILIYNPNGSSINITATFYDETGNETAIPITIDANRRYTLNINNALAGNIATSVKLSSSSSFTAERAMYWNGNGITWIGGHCSGGATAPTTSWYFAEGCTNGYDEFLLLLNPNSAAAEVTITTMDEDGNTEESSYSVNGHSRKTILISSFFSGNKAVSLKIVSTETIIAERSMYCCDNSSNWTGGTCDLGITAEVF